MNTSNTFSIASISNNCNVSLFVPFDVSSYIFSNMNQLRWDLGYCDDLDIARDLVNLIGHSTHKKSLKAFEKSLDEMGGSVNSCSFIWNTWQDSIYLSLKFVNSDDIFLVINLCDNMMSKSFKTANHIELRYMHKTAMYWPNLRTAYFNDNFDRKFSGQFKHFLKDITG